MNIFILQAHEDVVLKQFIDIETSITLVVIIKDCLPYLFHGFRNKYFYKISLDNMLYFQNNLYCPVRIFRT